ncbi:acyl-CoA dehydrogenase [Streptomyces sp. ODS28]|uniref:acyl-CoA dehydrogenase family protein n=1 Tax=Streptomyces sp. ODS28 TaxID=3136688 RepID=UPI0031E94AA7
MAAPCAEARREFDGILHDPHTRDARRRLLAVLGEMGERPVPASGHNARAHRDLRRLAQVVGPVRRMARGPRLLAAMSEGLAVADPPLYMTALNHYVLCLGSVLALCPDPARLAGELEALESARVKGSYLVTEVGEAGSHLQPRTTAEFDAERGEFVLRTPDNGAAKFSSVGAPGIAQAGVVCARLRHAGADCGVFSFLVDLSDAHGPAPGVHISGPLTAPDLPLEYALVRFSGVRLPYERWLSDGAEFDADGEFHDPLGSAQARLQRTLCAGQALWGTLPSALAAMARGCASQALRHSAHRCSGGGPSPGAAVLAHRPQQHALLGALAEAFALTCAGNAAREGWLRAVRTRAPYAPAEESAAPRAAFAPWSAVDGALPVYKALAAEGTARVAAECQQRSGLGGYLGVNRLPGYRGFAHAFRTAGGDDRLILLDAGRALAEHDGGPGPGASGYGASGHGASGYGASGHGVYSGAPGPLGTPQWWPAVAALRERTLTARLREALREREECGTRGLDLWNPLLEQARELGEAHAERLAADAVHHTLAAVRAPELRTALEPLAALYGVARARALAGGLQTAGVLTPGTARSLPTVMDGLCDLVLPHLPWLEEAMAAPPQLGRPPLGDAPYGDALADSLDWPGGGDRPGGGDQSGSGDRPGIDDQPRSGERPSVSNRQHRST